MEKVRLSIGYRPSYIVILRGWLCRGGVLVVGGNEILMGPACDWLVVDGDFYVDPVTSGADSNSLVLPGFG